MKKLIVYGIVLANLFTYSLYTGEYPILNKLDAQKVEQQKEFIVAALKKNYYVKMGIYCTVAGLAGYGVYAFFGPSSPDLEQKTVLEPDLLQQETFKALERNNYVLLKMQETLAVYEGLVENDSELKKQLAEKIKLQLAKPSFWSYAKNFVVDSFKNSVVMSLAGLLLTTVSPFTKYLTILDRGLDRLIDRVFYYEDLNWYLATHTTIFDIFKQTEQHACVLAGQVEPSGDFHYHYQGFVDSNNVSVQQLESILGFMIHRVNRLHEKNPMNAKRGVNLIERFFSKVNEHIDEMQHLLNQLPLEANGRRLPEKLKALHSFVQESLNAFIAIEFISEV